MNVRATLANNDANSMVASSDRVKLLDVLVRYGVFFKAIPTGEASYWQLLARQTLDAQPVLQGLAAFQAAVNISREGDSLPLRKKF